MSQSVANSVRGRCKVVAVSDAYRLAPWADALCSTDAAWWREHPDAIAFPGPKFGAMPEFQAIPCVERLPVGSHINSGLLGVHVAVRFGARKVLLCGFDMGGDHFFGRHPEPLKNTSPKRFEDFKLQFSRFNPLGIEIVNCTPGSGLKCYRMSSLEAEL
ncbi:MAG TPA: hypothetical protein VIK69_09140 [Methylophilaceae bacterium]